MVTSEGDRLQRFSRNDRWIVDEGLPFLTIFALPAILLFVLGYRIAAIPFVVLFLFSAWFFRNPLRRVPEQEGAVVSPADGRIVGIEDVVDERFGLGRTKRVSIFMSPFNVHVNRSPFEGTVSGVHYNPGKYFVATDDKASLLNEQNAVVLETVKGPTIVFVQIAGFIARRIVCYARAGDRLGRGVRFGLIRFGSRVDLYLPPATHILVGPGDRVKGGESIVGYLP
jgi:phosphatidylserine decarboxylase